MVGKRLEALFERKNNVTNGGIEGLGVVKRHSIPVGVRYGLFLKRHILEKPLTNHNVKRANAQLGWFFVGSADSSRQHFVGPP